VGLHYHDTVHKGDRMYSASMSDIDDSSKNRLEIYKDIEFEFEKLLDLRKTQKETEKCNYSDPADLY